MGNGPADQAKGVDQYSTLTPNKPLHLHKYPLNTRSTSEVEVS